MAELARGPEPGRQEPDAAALRLVLTTVADAEAGERLVRRLVEERLIACGNLVPGVLSVFRWEGSLSREPEVLVLMKTAASRVDALFARVQELHPYDVPELLSFGPEAGAAAYCRWVGQETAEVGS